jgi:hypothetical protein
MNIFDETELNKRLQEEESKFGLEEKSEELENLQEEEPEEAPAEVAQEPEKEEEEESIERPTDGKGWKEHREKQKILKAEAKEAKERAEQSARETAELRERLARLEGREEARVKPELKEVDTDPEPDADLDPDLHIKWQLRQQNKRIEAAERRAQMAEELVKVEGTRRGLQMVEKEYLKINKIDDYDDAIEHVKNVERNLIRLEHPQATDEQINNHLESERIRKSAECYSRGINPAEYMYKMAQTLGYAKTQKQESKNKPNIGAINRNMGKNANLIGTSSADDTNGMPTDKVVQMSIEQLLSREGQAAMDAAVKREEARLMGM